MSTTTDEIRPNRPSEVDSRVEISVGIADDEVLFRVGVRGVLERAERIVVVGEARDT